MSSGGTILATDINPAMISHGQKMVNDPLVNWKQADAVALPFEDGVFDCVVAQFGVMFYSDRLKAFREALRVLRPGGKFIFTTWNTIQKNPMAMITNETLKDFFPVNTPSFYSVPFSYFDEEEIRSDMENAGFRNFSIELTELTGFGKSAANAAKGLIHGTPTITAIEERDPEQLLPLMKELENKISARFGNESLRVPLSAFVVVGSVGK
jgi:ubiquinone/menaquinone biosynthesis C-methylase UbiE